MTEETTELGFPVEVQQAVQTMRGTYDGSRLPPAAKLAITSLLALPGVKVDQVATALGCSWETVVAVRESCRNSIREFKQGLAASWMSVLELASPTLLEKAKDGKLTVFDLKLLLDGILTLNNEATSIVEHRLVDPAADAARRAFQNPLWMGLGEGNVPALAPAASGAGAGLAAGSGPVREAELVEHGGELPPV
jgi:hypothetical protein